LFTININFHRIHYIVRAVLLFPETQCKNNPMRTGILHSSRHTTVCGTGYYRNSKFSNTTSTAYIETEIPVNIVRSSWPR